ncbi:MAG: ATP-binding protein [Lachnospiraceae bacterium]|nr:ATP-binding protein [Lachnospiraceae bacterium]
MPNRSTGTKRLPIGADNFAKIREDNFYYVDKTGLICDLLNHRNEVNLFTRPRRFGKSLNMSMLQCFFELGADSTLFDGLRISEETALCEEFLGKFPVISVSLKGINTPSFRIAFQMAVSIINAEARRFQYLLDSDRLTDTDKEEYARLLRHDMEEATLYNSLKTLSEVLEKHHGRQVIILIDEYDVPLAKAYDKGYYDEMVFLVRNLFEQALKTNHSLKFAVLTGCMRISKESIFTGLNNLKVFSITDERFDEYFGFTDAEVRQILDDYGVSEYYETTREWYDGYRFGAEKVYSPWDVINWCDQLVTTSDRMPQNFWANASGNDIIRGFAEQADGATRDQIGTLIEGGSVRKKLRQDLTYKELKDSIENLWSVLFTTGYLTQRSRAEDGSYELVIPNRELRELFITQIDSWFRDKVLDDTDGLRAFFAAIRAEDAEAMENCLIDYMEESVSYLDGGNVEEKENFYHGLLLGMLANWKEWNVVSNREAGIGRLDIVAWRRREKYAFILEVKYSRKEENLEAEAYKALNQIRQNRYDKVFGRHVPERVVHYGIAFCKKDCRVLKEVVGEK